MVFYFKLFFVGVGGRGGKRRWKTGAEMRSGAERGGERTPFIYTGAHGLRANMQFSSYYFRC